MKPTPQHIQRVYFSLILLNTLAASLIWGVNTLFLLAAGLSNTQAFLVNAFFTIGEVIFEVPTGIVADVKGRRVSYLLGALTLAVSTLLYLLAWYLQASLWLWAGSSILLGLGFTFFSGATEAWLVDALEFSGYKGKLETVFARGQSLSGVAMLVGSVAGGAIAQFSDLSVPYILRSLLLLATFAVAFIFMKDWGFEPRRQGTVIDDVKELFSSSLQFGWSRPAVRWMMLAAPFTAGVGFYTFYAMQPFLLELFGDPNAYGIAGLAAAIVAGSQIIGGLLVPQVHKVFTSRTSLVLSVTVATVLVLIAIGMVSNFWVAVALLCVWGLVSSLGQPVRQAYLNALIPSKQRATVLSFAALLGSSGGVVIQPALGRVADVWSYGASFVVGGIFQSIAVPFVWLAKNERVVEDKIE